jgi:hypothetical protein
MGQKRKEPSEAPKGKEVTFKPVKSARLGSRIKARPVRHNISSSPTKTASPPKASQTPTPSGPSSSTAQQESTFDYGYPFFDDQAGAVENTPGKSAKKAAGKVVSIYAMAQPSLTHFTDPESNAIRMVASQGCLFVRNINPRGAACKWKLPGMQR